jgi:hypothetical protein
MPDYIYEGEAITAEVTWYDKENVLTDPGVSYITIYDENELKVVDNQTMSKVDGSTSTYEYTYQSEVDAVPAGLRAVHYKTVCEAVVAGDKSIVPGVFVIRNVL